MDTLGSITSLYQVIQEYSTISGTRFARNSICCKITWYSWKNRQAMAHYLSFTLPRCFIRPLWLYQFDAFDAPQSCFHLMFLRYWCYVSWYYLCQHRIIAVCQLYECSVLSLNVSQRWTHFSEVTLLNLSISLFFFFYVNLYSLYVLFAICACIVYLECVHLSTPATYGREGNGLRASHEGRKRPETNFTCGIIWATKGTGAHTYFKTWEHG